MNSEFFSAYSSLICPQTKQDTKKPISFKQLTGILLLLLLQSYAALATNYYAEEQISRILQQEVDPKEIVWLDPDKPLKHIALYKEAQGIDVLGSILILADLNHHPDWPHIIRPLRNDLANHGWNTLSLQMPIKEKQASVIRLDTLYEIAESRINSAIDYLAKNENPNIIIIGRRHSANVAIKYLVEKPENNEKVTALVTISSFDSPWINSSQLIRKLPIPYLDVYAQIDTPEVLNSAPKRLTAAKFAGQKMDKEPQLMLSPKVRQLAKNKTGNLHYRQTKINGAQPNFSQHQDTLFKTIRGWLKNYEKFNK